MALLPKNKTTEKTSPKEMTFYEALPFVFENKITRVSWGTKKEYGLFKDGFLSLHKNGEANDVTHPWLINDGDLNGTDWIVF